MKLLFYLICFSWLLNRATFGQSPVTLTIETKQHGCQIPDDFAGLGFETWAEEPDRSGVSGHFFSPTNTGLITLFTNSGIRNLRLGGGTVDGLSAAVPNRADIDNLFNFARKTGIEVIYSFRLLNGDPVEDAGDAKYIWNHYRKQLAYFAIGNEPDVKSYIYPPFGKGTDPAITNYSSYLVTWRKFITTLNNAVPGAKIAGPDAAGDTWTSRFAGDEAEAQGVALVTQHEYVGGKPFIKGGRENMPASEAIDNMLSRSWVTNRYPMFYERTLAAVTTHSLPCRMTEANDYLRGVTNASNAFASALWALDYMHWWAEHGCAGVNFHNNQHTDWLKTDTMYLDGSSGKYQINPKAYAIRAFDLGSCGWVKPVVIGNPRGLNLTAYAVGDMNNLCVTIINKEHGAGAREALVTIAPQKFLSDSAEVMFLAAPKGNLEATRGITLGGASITNNAPWRGQWTTLDSPNRFCTVAVQPASAAVVKLSSIQN